MRIAALLVVMLLPVVGCVPPPVYRVQRTARVPYPVAPLRTGEPLAGPIELSVGGTSNAARAPELADKQAAIEVAREQLRSELRIRLGTRGELTTSFETAREHSMTALDDTQAPVRDGVPSGFGFGGRYSVQTDAPGLTIGVGADVMMWKIPYVEYRTCVENCAENNAPAMQINYGTDNAASFAASITPTYRHGELAVFANGYMRRHPTIVRKDTELYSQNASRDVDDGNFNFLVSAGVEYRLPVASVLATVQQNLTRDPVEYGPTFGLAIAFRVPDKKPLPRWPIWEHAAK